MMWELYDALIEQIPDDIIVDDVVVGGGDDVRRGKRQHRPCSIP